MTATNEDKREAVNMGVTISTTLINAALAMITLIGAFAVFVIDKKEVGFWYYLIAGLSFFCFIASIFAGGKGIAKAREDGASNGTWDINLTADIFNWQAILCILGILLFAASIFIGKEKVSEQVVLMKKTQQQVDSLLILVKDQQRAIDGLNGRYDELHHRFIEVSQKETIDTSKTHR